MSGVGLAPEGHMAARNFGITRATPPVTDPASALTRILDDKAIYPVFQPIVDLHSRKIVGVEALCRGPAGSFLEQPGALYEAAAREGTLADVDQLCCERALVAARDAGPVTPPLVFVNAEPAALTRAMTPDLAAVLSSGLPFRTVLKFTERALATAPAALLRVTDMVHAYGDSVALDDIGADPLSIAFLPLIEPAVVKLDLGLLRSAHQPVRAAVSGYARRSGAVVLVQGVETEQDAAGAVALGARWAQGGLFGSPGPLDAIAGRPVDRATSLRPARVDPPVGSAFEVACRRGAVRRGNRDSVAAEIDRVVGEVAAGGPHSVVVCAIGGSEELFDWLPRLPALGAGAGYSAALTTLPLPSPSRLHRAVPDPADPMTGETVIACIAPHRTLVFGTRPGPAGEGLQEFTCTEDRGTVQQIARMILRRFPSW